MRINFFEELKKKIKEKKTVISVIGLGYVGLPLAIELAQKGYRVIGIDTSPTKVEQLRNNESYIIDVSHTDLQKTKEKKSFYPSTDYSLLKETEIIIICVPTPLNKANEPDFSHIYEVAEQLQKYIRKGNLIVLESTIYPGATEELIQKRIEALAFKAGKDFFLCYSPERIDPGNKQYTTKNIPRTIAGVTPQCTELGRLLYQSIVQKVIVLSSPKVAEMAKLMENTFRSVNIAFINEMALMCECMGINIWEVIEAASSKPFGFMPFYPGPGIGGHCIPNDPVYLSWKAKNYRFNSKFIEISQEINNYMPLYVVNKVSETLNRSHKSMRESKILILGMAFKPEVNDLRESPSLKIYKELVKKGAEVDCHDPYVKIFTDFQGKTINCIPCSKLTLENYDVVILCTAHKAYTCELIARKAKCVIDTRNAFKNCESEHIFPIGCPSVSVQRGPS